MKKQTKKVLGVFLRYFTIVMVSMGNFYIFYALLTSLTIKTLAAVLRPFVDTVVVNTFIYTRVAIAEVAPSCIAVLAFFLLFFLVFSTADMKPKERFLALIISFAALFILNIARMVFLISIAHSPNYETIHWVLQNLLSTVAVAAIWIGTVSLLKIKEVPVFSDIKYIHGLIKKP